MFKVLRPSSSIILLNTVISILAHLTLSADFEDSNNETSLETEPAEMMFMKQIMHFDKMAREIPVVMVATDEEMDEMEGETRRLKREIGRAKRRSKKKRKKKTGSMMDFVLQRIPHVRSRELGNLATNRYECMGIECICMYLKGFFSNNKCMLKNGKDYQRIVRKEIRMMTEQELKRLVMSLFLKAMWSIQNSTLMDLSKIHGSIEKAPGAHSGPAFLPFHREFIKRTEIALRSVDETVFIPYWDSRLDAALEDPRGSVLWSDDLLGETNSRHEVVNGMFQGWKSHLGSVTTRRFAKPKTHLISHKHIDRVMREHKSIHQILAATAARPSCSHKADKTVLELLHGNNHLFVGGDMGQTLRSTNDVLFFMLHSFVDKTWEEWRQKWQSRHSRSSIYPSDDISCSAMSHWSRSIMAPFVPMTNKMGLSNKYTDNLYKYSASPTCNRKMKHCSSKYLFCDGRRFICVSRIRVGFKCNATKFGGVDPCYNSHCTRGICISKSIQKKGKWKRLELQRPPVVSEESCFNSNECCSTWVSNNLCNSTESVKMSLICAASCGRCKPKYRLNDDCRDRHSFCVNFSRKGECSKNSKWMNENCRRTCGRCAKSRSDTCSTKRINQ